jgi:hypothetical protein
MDSILETRKLLVDNLSTIARQTAESLLLVFVDLRLAGFVDAQIFNLSQGFRIPQNNLATRINALEPPNS